MERQLSSWKSHSIWRKTFAYYAKRWFPNSKCLCSRVVKGVVQQARIFMTAQVRIPPVHFLAVNSIFKIKIFPSVQILIPSPLPFFFNFQRCFSNYYLLIIRSFFSVFLILCHLWMNINQWKYSDVETKQKNHYYFSPWPSGGYGIFNKNITAPQNLSSFE